MITSLRFEEPAFLLLGLLAIPLAWLGWRSMAGADALRRIVALSLRTALLLALAALLARPHSMQKHNHLTVIGLLDISGSVQPSRWAWRMARRMMRRST